MSRKKKRGRRKHLGTENPKEQQSIEATNNLNSSSLDTSANNNSNSSANNHLESCQTINSNQESNLILNVSTESSHKRKKEKEENSLQKNKRQKRKEKQMENKQNRQQNQQQNKNENQNNQNQQNRNQNQKNTNKNQSRSQRQNRPQNQNQQNQTQQKKRKFENDQKRNNKKQKFENDNHQKFLDIYGPNAFPSFELQLHKRKGESDIHNVKIRDIQNLVLWILGEGTNPNWIFVKNTPLISKVVVLFVEGLTNHAYFSNKECMPSLSSFSKIQTIAPGSKNRVYSAVNAFLSVPVKSRKKQGEKEVGSFPISEFLLSSEQLAENNFPMKPALNEENLWITLKPLESGSQLLPNRNMLAIDCEMCQTEVGLELTRVSIIDESFNVVYDKLVLPPNKIVDYLTRWSGINEKTLEGVTTTLKDVQKDLLAIIPAETILVGHSLENDFMALKLIHNKILDTSVLFPHTRGSNYKNALKFLVQRYLSQMEFQASEHNSIEDAKMCLELVKLKLQNGPDFGTNQADSESLFKFFQNLKIPSVMVDKSFVIDEFSTPSTSCILTTSDDEVLEKTLKLLSTDSMKNFKFLWTHFCEFNSTEALTETKLSALDSKIQAIYDKLPKHTFFLVLGGNPSMNKIKELQKQKSDFPETWSETFENELEKLVKLSREGITFLKIKREEETNGPENNDTKLEEEMKEGTSKPEEEKQEETIDKEDTVNKQKEEETEEGEIKIENINE